MNSTAPIIELENVCFAYGSREILHNIDFRVESKSMTAIVGPNGGGKTTLLQLILGLIEPDRGSIRLLGNKPVQSRHRVGYVPQNFTFDKRFPVSVRDVVQMGAFRRESGANPDTESMLSRTLKQTGVSELIDQPFGQLSGGQRQRVLIATALVSSPELLILDEPTANVDPKSEHDLYELFRELNQTIPIIFVSHNLTVVTRHVSHILCVNHTARLHPIQEVVEGTLTELYGGELAIIGHGDHCHVTDPSRALKEPHHCPTPHRSA